MEIHPRYGGQWSKPEKELNPYDVPGAYLGKSDFSYQSRPGSVLAVIRYESDRSDYFYDPEFRLRHELGVIFFVRIKSQWTSITLHH